MKKQVDLYSFIRIRFGNSVALSLMLLICGVFLAIMVFLNYRGAGNQGHWELSDFMLIYLGGKGLLEGIDLYDPHAWKMLHVQFAGIYRDNPIFLYPLPAAFLFAPFALFSIRWGATLWLLVNEVLLILGVGWIMRQRKEKIGLSEFCSLVILIALYQPVIITIASGQYSMFMLVVLLASYAFLFREQDWLAGILASLLMLRPNPFVFFFPAMVIWAITRKRWKYPAGLVAAGFFMLVISEFIRPGWLGIWISYTIGIGGKLVTYAPISPTLSGLLGELNTSISPLAITWLQWLITVPLIIGGVWISLRRESTTGLIMSVLVTLSLSITPYAWNYDHIVLLFPFLYIILYLDHKPKWEKRLVWFLLFIVYGVFPYFLRFVATQRGRDTLSGFVPFGVLFIFLVLWVINSSKFQQDERQNRNTNNIESSISCDD